MAEGGGPLPTVDTREQYVDSKGENVDPRSQNYGQQGTHVGTQLTEPGSIVVVVNTHGKGFKDRDGGEIDGRIYQQLFVNKFGFTWLNRNSFQSSLYIDEWDHNKTEARKTSRANRDKAPEKCCLRCLIKYYDFSQTNCFVLAMSSHGCSATGETMISFLDKKLLPVSEIFEALSDEAIPSLRGKPRVVMLQACRTDINNTDNEPDYGVPLSVVVPSKNKVDVTGTSVANPTVERPLSASEIPEFTRVPVPANFLVVFSTTLGRPAARVRGGASHMEQELRTVVEEHDFENEPKMNLLKVLTKVAGRIANTDMHVNGSQVTKNSMCIEHRLIKPIYLTKLEDQECLNPNI